jgi:hypothetical protein
MDDDDTNETRDLAAGDFSSWVTAMQSAIRGERGSEVPCGGCTACCTSSQFVHVGPEETETRAHIPEELLFPAPGLPRGHALLGYDERGHCPMLIDGKCSIYDHRPRACRTYDCRVFPASGLGLDDGDTSAIARRARRWRFSLPSDADRDRHAAVRAAATFLDEHPELFPDGDGPNTTEHAVLAVELHDVFLRPGDPDGRAVRAELRRRLDARRS